MDPDDHLRGDRHGTIGLMMTDAEGRSRIFRSTVAVHIDTGLVEWWGKKVRRRTDSSRSTAPQKEVTARVQILQISPRMTIEKPKFQPLRESIVSLDPFVGCGRIDQAVSLR